MKFECIFAMKVRQTFNDIQYCQWVFLYPSARDYRKDIAVSIPTGHPRQLLLYVESLATFREADGFSCTYTSNFIGMPNSHEICVRANNSTPVATLFHETENLVSVHNGQVVTTSLQVAEVFQKRHCEVLRSIRELDCSKELQARNFAYSSYVADLHNGGHKELPMYYIGRDGFVFLVMGFTGKIAAKFKEAYIRQFNEMEEMLRKSKETQYANHLLDAQLDRFSRDLKAIVKRRQMEGHRFYGPAGELRTGFFYDKNDDFETKLQTVFSQIKNAYLDGFYFVEDMRESQKKLDAIGGRVREFIEGIHGSVDIY